MHYRLCEGATAKAFDEGCVDVMIEIRRVMRNGGECERPFQEAAWDSLSLAYSRCNASVVTAVLALIKEAAGALKGAAWLTADKKRELSRWVSTLRARVSE